MEKLNCNDKEPTHKMSDSEKETEMKSRDGDGMDSKELPLVKGDNPENRRIYAWIEEIVGSQFLQEIIYDGENNAGNRKRKFSLLEFELGKDEPSEDDLLRCSLGEGMVIPLKVVYLLDGVRTSNQLLMRLPTYFYDFAEDVNDETFLSPITVHTHETYFYSTVLPDIKNFLQSEGVDLKLAIPECFYVKHCPKYEMRKTPALVENLMSAKSLLLLLDPKGEGFNELESVEDVDLQEGLAAMTEMAKLHAVTWSMQEKRGRELNDIWEDLLSVVDQEAINDHVVEGSFELLSLGLGRNKAEGESPEDRNLYEKLLQMKPKIEEILKKTLYASGPNIPNSLLHMMIGGPNLFFRKKYNSSHGSERDLSDDLTETTECCIASWSLATIGNPILDVALFTCVSLITKVRSQYTGLFLKHYWQNFESVAQLLQVTPKFDFQYVLREFEKFQIWCYLFMIAACKQDDMKLEEIRDIVENILDILSNLEVQESGSVATLFN
ncbi:unnamed protein product [Allacma fusca]|uniref:CHK kinase-like domain-containing protein n=1 Tax=Allacma fusca TaxID=39272 RepID=A0A8J2LNS4_9HEXA|nr:unnamed protein product [Allacma fusca]